MKTTLSAADREAVEKAVKEGLEWLESHVDASPEEIKEAQKGWEDVIRPIFVRMYGAAGGGSAAAATEAEPRVEEVD